MSGTKIFVDSNILLCLFDGDMQRKTFAASLVNKNHSVSTQVVSENVNVCIRKLKLSREEAINHGTYLLRNLEVIELKASTIEKAFGLMSGYNFNYWDCLILAAALESGCNTLYTEDLQHNQVIEKQLKIINPFLTD